MRMVAPFGIVVRMAARMPTIDTGTPPSLHAVLFLQFRQFLFPEEFYVFLNACGLRLIDPESHHIQQFQQVVTDPANDYSVQLPAGQGSKGVTSGVRMMLVAISYHGCLSGIRIDFEKEGR